MFERPQAYGQVLEYQYPPKGRPDTPYSTASAETVGATCRVDDRLRGGKWGEIDILARRERRRDNTVERGRLGWRSAVYTRVEACSF